MNGSSAAAAVIAAAVVIMLRRPPAAGAPRTNVSRSLARLAVSGSRPDLVRPVPAQYAQNGYRVLDLVGALERAAGRELAITSGFRSKALNDAVDGSDTSQHMNAEAADVDFGSPAAARAMFVAILEGRVRVRDLGQVILYPGRSYLHVALPSARYPVPSFHVKRNGEYPRVADAQELSRLLA